MKRYNDQAQRELEAFFKGLSDEDLARARAFFSDTPVNSSLNDIANTDLKQARHENYSDNVSDEE